MSNVIPLKVPDPKQNFDLRVSALIANFALHRRQQGDVFWLKENAELLNVLECTGAGLSEIQLAPLLSFYSKIESQIGFFRQYYRFILSICLDLEDLGLVGNKGEAIAHWVAGQGLAEAELSDLQRAEAHRLMQRRNVAGMDDYAALEHRLHCFINRSDTFALPNRKAAYELTHIVFYLSEYGRRDPRLSQTARTSLEYAGLLAYLDQNSDLLSELCIAMRYAGEQPPMAWMDWLGRQTGGFIIDGDRSGRATDAYHDYLVCNWAMAVSDQPRFVQRVPIGAMQIRQSACDIGPLRHISQILFELQDHRSADWQSMRGHFHAGLSDEASDILAVAESSSSNFDSFFAGFARAGAVVG